nr:unnamed protein product [Callosobruchus chinensis]
MSASKVCKYTSDID